MNVKDINKRSLEKILVWCKNQYGESKFKNIDTLDVYIDETMNSMGSYCPFHNTIFINPKRHRSFISAIDTMIHEYTHFKQDIREMYYKYLTDYTFNYENHPYEITAKETAKRDKRICYREVFGK